MFLFRTKPLESLVQADPEGGLKRVLGPVNLVALADPPPMPEGMAWGERGVCEVCVHVKAQDKLY